MHTGNPVRAYQGSDPYLFVSYSHFDSDLVVNEISWLQERGLNIWFDEGVDVGSRWSEDIANRLTEAKILLFFVTPNSVNSFHCQDEINFALDEKIPTIVVYLEDTHLTPGLRLRLSSRQAIFMYELELSHYRERLFLAASRILEKVATSKSAKSGAKPAIRASTQSSVQHRIAVLPFANISQGNENEYFSDGISEEILNTLVQTNRIPVIARSSSFQFKGDNRQAAEIGSILGVSHLLEGSVRKSNNTVRITAQLVEVAGGVQLWSDSYDRELADVFEVQDEIAHRIVDEIGRVMDDDQQHIRVSSRKDASPEVYNLYMRGMHAMNSDDPFEVEGAISMFEHAIALDRHYADAWARLGFCYLKISNIPVVRKIPAQVHSMAIEALEKALELAPAHAFATGWLGYALISHHFEWSKGLQLMQKSLKMNPQDAQILAFYGFLLANMGDPKGDVNLDKAYLMNPLDPLVILMRAIRLGLSGRLLDGVALMETALIQNRDGYMPNSMAAFFNALFTRSSKAEKYLKKAIKIVGPDCLALKPAEYFIARNTGNDELAEKLKKIIYLESATRRVPFLFYIDWNQEELEVVIERIISQRHPEAQAFLFADRPALLSQAKWQEILSTTRVGEAMAYQNALVIE